MADLDMKTFLDGVLKALTGALAVGIIIAAAGSQAFPITFPLFTTSGKLAVFNVPDALGLIALVLPAAIAFHIIGDNIGKATHVPWSKL